ncbi:MAG: hypothetical protein ACREL5_14275, partial [Gemmatimonadales bacterium]
MALAAGIFLLIFGLLPIANWIPGGHDYPGYADHLAGWLSGGAISLGIGVIAAIATRRYPGLWRAGLWARVAARWRTGGRRADFAIAAIVTVVCAVVAQLVFSAKPLLIDEIIQLYQAKIFAAGRLWLPAPAWPEFTSAMHLLDWNGKVYGQFPAGGPAMLALGVLVHAPWLVGPVATGIGAFLFARLLRRIEARDGTALAALLLFAFAPFTVFLGGTMMNHVTAMTWILGGALALAVAVDLLPGAEVGTPSAHPVACLVMGLCFGIAATIRPADGAAFAIPAAVWLLWRARLGRDHFGALLLSGVGVAIPMALLFWVNAHQTGHALRFGYIEMWGVSHEIGFHAAPWGPPHTPARGVELINLYLLRLEEYLFESAGPGLLFAVGALALTVTVRGFDRWMLAGGGLLLLGYFAYWHDGFYLGPRFVLPLAPWLALWTARLPAVMERRRIAMPAVRTVVIGGVVSLLLGAVIAVPIRARQYHNGMLSMRFDIDQLAAAHGVHDAVVLVRESWGAQMMARMWGLGVSRTDAEHIYRTTDACRMELALEGTERSGGDADALKHRLAPYAADSGKVRTFKSLPDTTIRLVPGETLADVCVRRIHEDQAGFTLYTP